MTSLTGEASVQRVDGTLVTLKVGDAVFQGDVVQTGATGKLGVTFVDGSIFSLSDNARMVLNNLVFDPDGSDNSMLFTIVDGTFAAVAGQVAPTGDMKIATPVATMGIRGTVVFGIEGVDGNYDLGPAAQTRTAVAGKYVLLDLRTGALLARVGRTPGKVNVSGSGLVKMFPRRLSAFWRKPKSRGP